MPRVKFTATAEHKQWLHRKGGVVDGSYGGKATKKIVGPVILKDGDVQQMDDFEAEWCLKHLPSNFELVEEKKAKAKKSDSPEVSDE